MRDLEIEAGHEELETQYVWEEQLDEELRRLLEASDDELMAKYLAHHDGDQALARYALNMAKIRLVALTAGSWKQ